MRSLTVRIFLGFTSVFLTLLILALSLLLINFVISYTCPDCVPTFSNWTLEGATYSSNYLFWAKPICAPNCQKHPEDLAPQVIIFNEEFGQCYTVLFIGDSFTVSSGIPEGNSYTERFASSLSQHRQTCVKLIRLATSGSGNDQQFAKFNDTVDLIKPNLVIWQFYYNDYYENATYALYQPIEEQDHKTFVRKKVIFNGLLWAGIINQNIPMIKGTHLGQYLMYVGETKDIFHTWYHLVKTDTTLLEFNKEKITFFIAEMTKMATHSDFTFATTLAPLECEVISFTNCKQITIQAHLRELLKANTSYLAMDKTSFSDDELSIFQPNLLFEPDDFKIKTEPYLEGTRHLTETGHQKASLILFSHYISKYEN